MSVDHSLPVNDPLTFRYRVHYSTTVPGVTSSYFLDSKFQAKVSGKNKIEMKELGPKQKFEVSPLSWSTQMNPILAKNKNTITFMTRYRAMSFYNMSIRNRSIRKG